MIRKDTFYLLHRRKRLYKCATALRQAEMELARDGATDLKPFQDYASYLREDSHQLSQQAADLFEACLAASAKPETLRRAVNHAFHEISIMARQPVKEEDFLTHTIHRFDSKTERTVFPLAVLLDNLRSPFNTGSVFRSAECFGFQEVLLTGITPDPEGSKVQRTAMGMEKILPWRRFETTEEALKKLSEEGWQIAAMETASHAIPIRELDTSVPTVLVMGNEEYGLSEEILEMCDTVVNIPLYGVKNSLNVAAAFAVAAYELTRARN